MLLLEYLQPESVQEFIVYYDINCRYQAHHRLHPEILGAACSKFTFVIPAFHAYAHGLTCLRLFYPMLTRGCGKTEGEVSEREWRYTNLFAAMAKEMSSDNRHVLYEDVLLFSWFRSQRKQPMVIMFKLRNLKPELEELEDFRLSWTETDDDLDLMTANYKQPPRQFVTVYSKEQARIHTFDSKIRHEMMEIGGLFKAISRKWQKCKSFVLKAAHKKQRHSLQQRVVKMYAKIEGWRTQRNALVVPVPGLQNVEDAPFYHRILEKDDIRTKERMLNWFWLGQIDVHEYEEETKVLIWEKLKRYREEFSMLKNEQKVWIEHAKMDIEHLSQNLYTGDDHMRGRVLRILQNREIKAIRESGECGGLKLSV